MNKKDVTFTIGLTILMGVIWAVGELVMGLWLAVVPSAHIFWFALIVIITLGISVWHSMIEDNSDLEDPKRAKYERKVNKRKKN
ncbi:hypothetical protein [Ruminococcus flavefaciens]|uniref:hypothetical protein n=1 Tax=Ruminococcus flavefaciens TaxID=1265 RepID=UPI0026F1BCCB|nr:hypothetical protein [Ruminococcus flavefaciens]